MQNITVRYILWGVVKVSIMWHIIILQNNISKKLLNKQILFIIGSFPLKGVKLETAFHYKINRVLNHLSKRAAIVDFPLPDVPTIATVFPAGSFKLKSLSIT